MWGLLKLWPAVLRPSFGHFTLMSSSDRLEFDLPFSRNDEKIMIGNEKMVDELTSLTSMESQSALF